MASLPVSQVVAFGSCTVYHKHARLRKAAEFERDEGNPRKYEEAIRGFVRGSPNGPGRDVCPERITWSFVHGRA